MKISFVQARGQPDMRRPTANYQQLDTVPGVGAAAEPMAVADKADRYGKLHTLPF
jgi:hypothetical protein